MERGSDLSFTEVTDFLDKAGAFSRGANVDAWNVSPMHPPIIKSYNTLCPNMADTRVACSQFIAGKRDSQAFGAASRTPLYPPPTFSDFPNSLFGGFPLRNTASKLDAGPLSCGKGNVGFHGAMRCILEPSQVQSNKFDVQPFDSCQRRFVMFDCEGSKRRMIFHPALVNENSALVPSKSKTVVAYNHDASSDKDNTGKGKYITSPSSALIAPLSAPLSIYNPCTQSTNANLNFISLTSDNLITPFSAVRHIAEAKIDLNQLDFSAEISDFSHEDTQDLEALLSSDEDEVSSTGHSPSDITRQLSPIERHACNRPNGKRRMRGWEAHVDDMCSTGTSGNNMREAMSSQNVEGAGIEASHSKEGVAFQIAARGKCLCYTEEVSAACNVVISDELSSSSSANYKKYRIKSPSMREGQQPDQQAKKEKIRSILHLLRGILPGGETMDAAFVLDETIQYVKALQFEVQKLQAGKLLKS